MVKSPEVRLYKMIEECGWKNNSFYVCISYENVENFIKYLYEQFSNNAIETKNIRAILTCNHLMINLSEELDDLVNINSVFPKRRLPMVRKENKKMCDECEYMKIVHPKYNYCPNCGRKLVNIKKKGNKENGVDERKN